MALIRLFPENTDIRFMKARMMALPVSIFLILASLFLFFSSGLNLGIDFKGGSLLEVSFQDGPANIQAVREGLDELNLGDVQVQEYGEPETILIRIEEQDGGEEAQQVAIESAKAFLSEMNIDDSRTRAEVVGPLVSAELARSGAIAIITALFAILIYIWVRFEWQFALGAIAATAHDVLLTIGFFALTKIDFGLSSIAAILTIIGYSLNDTVVVYDRIRENLRRYKKMPLPDLIDLSINQMLTRTILTSVTTLLALGSLFFFGGEVMESFTAGMLWGVFIGTFSSIFVAGPILIWLGLKRKNSEDKEAVT